LHLQNQSKERVGVLAAALLSLVAIEVLLLAASIVYLLGQNWAVHVAIGVPIGVVIALRFVIVALTFVLSGAWRGRLWSSFRALVGETVTVGYLYSFAQPFHGWWHKSRNVALGSPENSSDIAAVSTSVTSDIVVVLVHGFLCNGGMWTGVRTALRKQGYKRVHAVNLDPCYRSMPHSLRVFERQLRKIMREECVGEVVVIGHSMGGVLARVFQHRRPKLVRAAISLGAPHTGTELARLVSSVKAGPARRDTRWLLSFNAARAAETHDPDTLPALNIWSCNDNIVSPQEAARLTGARDYALNGVGHLQLVFDRRALKLITEFISTLVLPQQTLS
jgi:triacylglycerol lipase